jgi:transcription antitermination factor NusG
VAIAWYAAKTKPCSEFIAEDWLKNNGFGRLNAKYRDTRMERGTKVTRERPYFSGYILINMDCDIVRWQRVNTGRGIKSLICANEFPVRIPDEAIAIVRGFCDNEDFVPAFEVDRTLVKTFELNDRLKVSGGQWSGFIGTVEQVQRQRITMLTSLFGRQTKMTVDASMLEKV